MNDIPHLDNAMWAFDDAGLPYPELPEGTASVSPEVATPSPVEMQNSEIVEGESMASPIPLC